jgi:hypothetical protein
LEDEIGEASSMCRREMHEDFQWGSLKESDHWKDLEVKLMIFF